MKNPTLYQPYRESLLYPPQDAVLWFVVVFTNTITECYINTLFTRVSLSLKSKYHCLFPENMIIICLVETLVLICAHLNPIT